MDQNLTYIIVCIVVLALAFFFVKKIASCLIKSVIMILLAGAMAFIYFNYIKEYGEGEEKPAVIQKMDQKMHDQIDKMKQHKK
ncbi:MAG: hypothetical protein IKT00_09135 [Prevotella sp.]|nr:hypothetical protein [Prevotella sp.]